MTRKVKHSLLDNAKINKNDEFYTQLCDIERELQHYTGHFENKVVFCNCDDVRISNFFKYFVQHFKELKLKKVIGACYKKSADTLQHGATNQAGGFYYEYTGVENPQPTLKEVICFKGDGDFRSEESMALLKQSDVVVSNPPFSLFREYVGQLVQYNKKFLIIGNINAITYKEIFNLIKENKVWLGINLGRGISGFIVPEHYELYGTETAINASGERIVSTNNCLWLTNLDNARRHENMALTKRYMGNEMQYARYDNYQGINVNNTKDIPLDYPGAMGVPITFLHKFNPNQFEIIQFRKGDDGKDLSINGKCPYFRILIRHKQADFRGNLSL
ncbi:MAG: adenine-specific methyltransferase EcoRI family protein [Elusimicrobiaceae bacterium]|nr:adenine-specific methyltransferase EcoRI family protein [Elusimicrobiaceae bacterium]